MGFGENHIFVRLTDMAGRQDLPPATGDQREVPCRTSSSEHRAPRVLQSLDSPEPGRNGAQKAAMGRRAKCFKRMLDSGRGRSRD